MVAFTILAGSFTTLISAFSFVPAATEGGRGRLSLISQSFAGKAPSWIQKSPHNSSILYAVNEDPDGQVASFTIGDQGIVRLVASTPSGGYGPTHLSPLKRHREVAVVNYYAGTSVVFPLQNDLLHFVTDPAPPLITFPSGPTPNTQSHPHQIVEIEDQLFVPDVGTDKIWRLNRGLSGAWRITNFITQPPGSGPRHLVSQDGILYILHEKVSLITSQRIPPNTQTSSPFISSIYTTPRNVDKNNYASGEIKIAPTTEDFPDRYIYTSNMQIRGPRDPLGDTIAIFRVRPNGVLELLKHVSTGLQNLRGFVIDPSGRYLVAGGNLGGGVKVFERINGGADLVEVGGSTQVATASSFVWL